MGRTTNGIEVDQQSVASDGGGTPQLARRRLYVSVTVKFVVAQVVAAGWIVGPYTLAVLPLTLVVNLTCTASNDAGSSTCSASGSAAMPSASWGSS